MSAPWKGKASSTTFEDRELPPSGTHPAVLVAIVDLGTHEDDYGGESKWNRKVYLAWELTAEKGRPVVGRDFTLSFHTKALLRQFLERWRGRQFGDGEDIDISAALGKPCLLTYTHKPSGDRTFGKVEAISGVPRGTSVPGPEHKPLLWSLDDGDPRKGLPEWLPYLYGRSLPEWIEACRERRGGGKPAPPEAPAIQGGSEVPDGDPVPF